MVGGTLDQVGALKGSVDGVVTGRVSDTSGDVAFGVGKAGNDVVADNVGVGRVQTECDEVAGFELVFRNVGGEEGEMAGWYK